MRIAIKEFCKNNLFFLQITSVVFCILGVNLPRFFSPTDNLLLGSISEFALTMMGISLLLVFILSVLKITGADRDTPIRLIVVLVFEFCSFLATCIVGGLGGMLNLLGYTSTANYLIFNQLLAVPFFSTVVLGMLLVVTIRMRKQNTT